MILSDEQKTQTYAKMLAKSLFAPLLIGFSGEIGAGKTTLIRAMLHSLGYSDKVKSPTYTLVETYDLSLFTVHHFDFYRIHDELELDYLGLGDYMTESSVCFIEWPEQAPAIMEQLDLVCFISYHGEGERSLRWHANTTLGKKFLTSLDNVL